MNKKCHKQNKDDCGEEHRNAVEDYSQHGEEFLPLLLTRSGYAEDQTNKVSDDSENRRA